MMSYGKGSDNSRTGTAKIAQSHVESVLILWVVVNKTLICAEKEEIRMGGGIETLIRYRAEV